MRCGEKGPIYKQAGRDYVVVTGFDEALDVLRNTEDFSSAITVQGAGMQLPFVSEQADITSRYRGQSRQIPWRRFAGDHGWQPASFFPFVDQRLVHAVPAEGQ